jgi:Na+-transporting methylmalonyl-CoA/oxaloacetate decarboxylase gamma subunit
MEALKTSIATYVITTAFAFFIAWMLYLMAIGIKKLGLEQAEAAAAEPAEPPAEADEPARVALAIAAAAHAARSKR